MIIFLHLTLYRIATTCRPFINSDTWNYNFIIFSTRYDIYYDCGIDKLIYSERIAALVHTEY